MRVFVTGGTGFVGSHVVEKLLEQGHEPVCLVRETSDTEHLDELGVETYLGSLTEIDGLRPALQDCEAVVHIAGVVKVPEPRMFYQINGEATCQLVEAAADENPDLERFVYVSSIAAQGPCFEPEGGEVDPDPVSHYGKSKLLGEQGVRGVADEIPTTIFRPPPVYGPRDEEMFAVFQGASWGVAPVYGDGEQRTSVVHVFDLADAVEASLKREHPSGMVFGIDDGYYYTWGELAELCGGAMGKNPVQLCIPSPFFKVAARANELRSKLTGNAVIFTRDKVREMDQDDWVCGNDRLCEELDWQPSWPFEDGAQQTVEWYRDNGWL